MQVKVHLVRLSPEYVRRHLGLFSSEVEFVRLKEAQLVVSTLADRGTCTFIHTGRPLVLVIGGALPEGKVFVREDTQCPVPTFMCRIETLEATIRHVTEI